MPESLKLTQRQDFSNRLRAFDFQLFEGHGLLILPIGIGKRDVERDGLSSVGPGRQLRAEVFVAGIDPFF